MRRSATQNINPKGLEKQNVKKSHSQREPVDRVPELFTAAVGSGHLGAAALNHDVCKYCTFNRTFFRGSQKTLVPGFTSIDLGSFYSPQRAGDLSGRVKKKRDKNMEGESFFTSCFLPHLHALLRVQQIHSGFPQICRSFTSGSEHFKLCGKRRSASKHTEDYKV